MKKSTKALIGVIAATSLTIAAVSVIFSGNPVADATGASFNGISNIIKGAAAKTPFTVVELVPDKKMAKFGYLIDGSEPENWKEELTKLHSKEDRMQYMNDLHNRLSKISAEDKTKPLTYGEYKEAYSLDDVNSENEADYSSFELETPIELTKGDSGYKMIDSPKGSFKVGVTYHEKYGGDYDENVENYEFSKSTTGKYAVKFKKAASTDFNNKVIYKAHEIGDPLNADDLVNLTNTRYIYVKPKGSSGSAVEYKFALSNQNMDNYHFDSETYDYVLLSFEKIDSGKLTSGEKKNNVYYIVENAEYSDHEAEYNGVLNEANPYKKVNKGKGHFDANTTESYVFVGKGRGDKKLIEDDEAVIDYDLTLNKVFYTGGFKNNNWFENGVFLKNFNNGEYLAQNDPNYNNDKMKFKLVSLTPGELNEEIRKNPGFLSQVGLLYISVSSSLADEGELKTYSGGNDIDSAALNKINKEIKSRNLPVIFEYGEGNSYSAVNMNALANDIAIAGNSVDKDNDHHFVNKSVYVINKDKKNSMPAIFDSFATAFIKGDQNNFVELADNQGFKEIAESILEENNIIRQGIQGTTDNTEFFKLEISKARAIEYIISFNSKRRKATDDVIKVLDIEPAKVVGQNSDNSQRIKEKIAAWFSPNITDIKSSSVTMPTSEFIGKTDDLSNYDIIYVGLDTSSFNYKDEPIIVDEVVPAEVKPSVSVQGVWLQNPAPKIWKPGKREPNRKINPQNVIVQTQGKNKTYTVPGYVKPGYDIPGYWIPATTTSRPAGRRREYFRPGYTIGGYTIPGYTKKVFKGVDNVISYNDPNMNGLIYSNVGDIYKSQMDRILKYKYSIRAGMLDTDYKITNNQYNNIEAYRDADPDTDGIKINFKPGMTEVDYHKNNNPDFKVSDQPLTYRFAGNDITKEKFDKLITYINEGYPVVFADGFLNEQGNINEKKIDNSSRMYELADYALTNGRNVIFEGVNGSLDSEHRNNLINYVNLPKPQIQLKEQNFENDPTNNKSEYTKIYNRTLQIDFKLLNKGYDANFRVSLFIDRNADGKFSATHEIVNRKHFAIYNGKDIQTGDIAASDDIWYRLSYKLPENYVGVVPWKLKVELIDKDGVGRHTSIMGFGHVEKSGERQKIKILQIKSAGLVKNHYNQNYYGDERYYKFNKSFLFSDNHKPTASHVTGSYSWPTVNNFDMATSPVFDNNTDNVIKKSNEKFRTLLSMVKDFDITVDSMTASEFAENYGTWRYYNKSKRPEEYFDSDNNSYDMIVLGFADCYSIPNTNNCLEAVQGFINSGKPVLFTHDCSSFINYRGASPWGYDFNRIIRGQVGLDRYGVLNNWPLRVGCGYTKNATTSIPGAGYPTIVANKGGGVLTSGHLFNIAEKNSEIDSKDIAYEPKSNRTKIVREVQGLAYGTLIQGNAETNPEKDKMAKQYKVYGGFGNKTSFRTTRVEQVNKGQITTYPFRIPENLEVAVTHDQPYQLDLNEDADDDGESDLIVWYTLGGTDNAFALSPKDVRNNYYIYTKGNITYSGVGHSPIQESNLDEMKLYINTLVAAYKAALQSPTINFKESGDIDSAEKNVSYISYDVSADGKNGTILNNENVRVYFMPDDINDFAKNVKSKETRILVRPFKPDLSLYNVFTANGEKVNQEVDNKAGNCYVLKKDAVYYFDVPVSYLLENTNKLVINLRARTRFVKDYRKSAENAYTYSPEGTSTYLIQKRGLFDLD